ncbi:MAG: hypothetical protein QM765_44205 [Myxococcales bacterium]
MARLAFLLALPLLLASCYQEIRGLEDPPDADEVVSGPDADVEPGGPDAAKPRLDAGQPPGRDASHPGPPDAAAYDAGSCIVTPSPARVNQPVTITCPSQPSMGGPSWTVDGADGGYLFAGGSSPESTTFTMLSVPKNFADTTLTVRATWHGAGGDGVALAPVSLLGNLWVGRTTPAVIAFTTSPEYTKWGGENISVVGSAAFTTTPRALALLSNGDVLVAQSSLSTPVPPVIVIGRNDMLRKLDFESQASGELLFNSDKQISPRALIQAENGTVWVTGGPEPILYSASGKYLGRPTAAAKPSANTVGIAQLKSKEIVVSMGTLKLGRYSADGSSYTETGVLENLGGYSQIQAICALPDGGLVISLNRFQPKSGGLLVQLDSSFAFVRETPSENWLPSEIPAQVIRVGDEYVATPGIINGGSNLYRYDQNLKLLGTFGEPNTPHYAGVVRLQ